MSTNELTSRVKELKELKIMAEELAAEITAIEDTIKDEMTMRNTEEIIVDMFKVRYTTVKSRRFDTTAFKATHATLYDQYSKETVTKRFSVA